MSTMRTDLLQNRLGISHPAVTRADFIKAHYFLAQTNTQALLGSFNVTGIQDGGVGITQINFAAPMASANFTHVVSSDNTNSDYTRAVIYLQTATYCSYLGLRSTSLANDIASAPGIVTGTLA